MSKKYKNKKIFGVLGVFLIISTLFFTPLNAVHAEQQQGTFWAGFYNGSLATNPLARAVNWACDRYTDNGCINAVKNKALDIAVSAITEPANKLLSKVGLLFDVALYQTTNGNNYNNRPNGGIYEAWEVFRDLMNVLFIFIVIYIGLRTILQIGGRGDRQLLVYVIIIALLLNFSLVITSVIIDASNILALAFYDQFTTPNQQVAADANSVSLVFMKATEPLRSQGQQHYAATASTNPSSPSAGTKILGAVLNSIVMIIALLVMLLVALLFILRIPVLWFYMILSPLAFAAFILPGTRSSFNRWLYGLLKNAFFAPIFMALFLAVGVLFNSPIFTSASSITSQSWVVFFLKYAIAIGMTIGALIVSKMVGAYGAATVVNRSQKFAKRRAVRTGSFAGRHTIGRAASAVKDSETARRAAERAPRFLSTPAIKGLENLSKAQFGNKKEGAKSFNEVKEQKVKDNVKTIDYISTDKYGRERTRKVREETGEHDVGGPVTRIVEKNAREAYIDKIAEQRSKWRLSGYKRGGPVKDVDITVGFREVPVEKNGKPVIDPSTGRQKTKKQPIKKAYGIGGKQIVADRETLQKLAKDSGKDKNAKLLEELGDALKPKDDSDDDEE